MLSDIFSGLQNKVYTDSRDFPVSLTESYYIDGTYTDDNRKIKLGEKVHSLQNVLVYNVFPSSSSLNITVTGYSSLAIFYSEVDLTVNYTSYDATNDIYHFDVYLFRSDTLETWSHGYDITGSFGQSSVLQFNTIWGNFSLLVSNWITGAQAVISMIAYESSVLVMDSFNPFIGNGATNHIFFNIPANSVYINQMPAPWNNGNVYVVVQYMGLGSIITAESLNDIISIVKYYNLLPKFSVTKNNNNDIELYILGEYYYLNNYVEKISDATYQLANEVLLGQQNALMAFLDIPNQVFSVTRVAVGDTYDNLIADMTNFTVENPQFEMPIFVLIFDTNKNLFEQAYVNRSGFSISASSSVNKYNIALSNTLNASFTMGTDSKPVVMVWDQDGNQVIPDNIQVTGGLVSVTFLNPQSGSIAAVN